MPPEQLDPRDDQAGTPDHRIERSQGLLSAEPLDPLYEEFEIGFDRTEIDVLSVMLWHGWVVIVWHAIDRARSWLKTGYDEGR
jgi:hypothetical protein